MQKLFACMVVMLFMVTASTVCAGERSGAFVVSPYVGGHTFDGVERLETRPMVGLRLGYDFTKNFGLEANFNYVSTRFNNNLIPGNVSVYNYRLEGVYNFMPESSLVPYLAIGGGGQTIDLPGSIFNFGKIHNTQPTAAAGAGIKWFISEDVAFRLDYHQNFIINANDVNNKRQDYLMNYEYSLGLQMLFGGEKPLPPTSSLSAVPGSITKGQSATLSWTSQNAMNCDMAPAVGPVQPQGSMSVSPTADTTYTLTCTGAAGKTSSTVNVAVSTPPPPPPPMPTATLSAVPASITQGDAATLSWSSQNASNCDMQPAIGSVQPQGSMSVKPSADTVYTLNCSGPGGSTSSTVNVAVAVPPPPPAPAPECPVVLTPEQEETVNLLIEFDTDKAVIKPQFYPNVDALGEFLKKYPCEVDLEGHTDNVGSAKYNMKLSQRRADAVKKYIVDKFGVDPTLIKAVGYGKSKPIDTNKTAEGRYHNRRVQAHHGAVKKVEKP